MARTWPCRTGPCRRASPAGGRCCWCTAWASMWAATTRWPAASTTGGLRCGATTSTAMANRPGRAADSRRTCGCWTTWRTWWTPPAPACRQGNPWCCWATAWAGWWPRGLSPCTCGRWMRWCCPPPHSMRAWAPCKSCCWPRCRALRPTCAWATGWTRNTSRTTAPWWRPTWPTRCATTASVPAWPASLPTAAPPPWPALRIGVCPRC